MKSLVLALSFLAVTVTPVAAEETVAVHIVAEETVVVHNTKQYEIAGYVHESVRYLTIGVVGNRTFKIAYRHVRGPEEKPLSVSVVLGWLKDDTDKDEISVRKLSRFEVLSFHHKLREELLGSIYISCDKSCDRALSEAMMTLLKEKSITISSDSEIDTPGGEQ
jgi:hypothetical protein